MYGWKNLGMVGAIADSVSDLQRYGTPETCLKSLPPGRAAKEEYTRFERIIPPAGRHTVRCRAGCCRRSGKKHKEANNAKHCNQNHPAQDTAPLFVDPGMQCDRQRCSNPNPGSGSEYFDGHPGARGHSHTVDPDRDLHRDACANKHCGCADFVNQSNPCWGSSDKDHRLPQ